jgi:nucleoside-diphosphate-sugar epimerase
VDRQILILTGATGNLGRNLIKELSNEYEIISLSLRTPDFLQNLTRIASSLADRIHEAILIHAAWPVSGIDYRNHQDNKIILEKSKQLINAFADVSDGRIFGIGSIAEVGRQTMVFDDTPPNPECMYSECKSELQEWTSEKAPNSKWLRVSYQFSAFDPRHKLFPTLLYENMPLLRNPDVKYDYIHVSDVARGIRIAINADLPPKMLISNGRSYSSREIATSLGIGHTLRLDGGNFEQKTFPSFLKELHWNPSFSDVKSFRDALNSEVNS